MTTYLITGGAGFIGSNIAVHLARGGHTVRILDNFSNSNRDQFIDQLGEYSSRVIVLDGDVRDLPDCRRACIEADFVLHHAGVASIGQSLDRPDEAVSVIAGGTANMLIASKESGCVQRFVHASSCAVYGDGPTSTKHESSPLHPISPYGSATLAAEFLCENYYGNFGFPTLSLRYFNVYGFGENPHRAGASVIAKFVDDYAAQRQPTVYGDGEQSRDFIHVADVVDACLSACLSGANSFGQAFNIGTSNRTTIKSVLELISTIMEAEIIPNHLPIQRGHIRHSRADITKAAGLLQFTPTVTVADGVGHVLSAFAPQLLAA